MATCAAWSILAIFLMTQPSPRSINTGGKFMIRAGGRLSSRPRPELPGPPLPPLRSRLFMSNCAGAAVLAFGGPGCLAMRCLLVRAETCGDPLKVFDADG